MKRVLLFLSIIISLVVFIGCDDREKLYVLNWEEYINKDIIQAFEEEFGVKVVLDTATSNESMYNKIKNRSGKYDIVIPSDYMIERMQSEDLLIKLDYSKLSNYDVAKFDTNLQALRVEYFAENQDYGVPYFWGTLGIMYNNKKAGVKGLVEENGWKVFFEEDLIPKGVTVGMYDSSRDAVAAAELYLNYDLNTTDTAKLDEIENLLKNNFFSQWGTDELKTAVVSQNLDIALVYSGDFFDQVFLSLETDSEITFDMFVPTTYNNVWFDAMVIPNTATKIDLAHEFINYFLDYEVALENASYVGYCPTMHAVYEEMKADEELEEVVLHPGYYPGNVTNGAVYRHLGEVIALRMDDILTKAKVG
ncbi:MAG: ABC transporter substrate-binding protein [Bacilli bacterium]|nr:ABC transporter substrate-binding protein [Bacilli bacterium]